MLEPAICQLLANSNRPIVVTGASGWLGLATLDLLERALQDRFAQRVHCYGSAPRVLELGGGRRVEQRALADLAQLDQKGAWLLHFAFLTKDRASEMDDESYRAANVQIRDTVTSALDAIDAAGIFVASSGAASKADDAAASPAMRLYGTLKRDDEAHFAAWGAAHNKRVVIGRIFNIAGPYINKHQAYALASFILDARAGRPIAVRAERAVIRSYVAIRELMSLVFSLLAANGNALVRFDTGGEVLELGEVAGIVSRVLDGAGVERAPIRNPVPDRYVGDGETYARLLAENGVDVVPLGQQILETARFFAASS